MNRYGSRIIDSLIKTGYKIVIRPHPQSFISDKELMDELMSKYLNSDMFQWNKDNDNFEVLKKADIMISDFSGVMFDFALVFNKPVIYADVSYDSSVYDSCWLDEKMWTFETIEKIGKKLESKDIDNIKEVIDSCVNNKEIEEAREIARKQAWSNVGNSDKLIVDYMINKRNELIKKN